MRQLRQGCYCRLWDAMSQNSSLIQNQPLIAAHALLVTGHRDFRPLAFSLDMINIVDAMFSTVPTLISFGVLVGKMAPVQNVVLVRRPDSNLSESGLVSLPSPVHQLVATH